jgi:hypothetical protein
MHNTPVFNVGRGERLEHDAVMSFVVCLVTRAAVQGVLTNILSSSLSIMHNALCSTSGVAKRLETDARVLRYVIRLPQVHRPEAGR